MSQTRGEDETPAAAPGAPANAADRERAGPGESAGEDAGESAAEREGPRRVVAALGLAGALVPFVFLLLRHVGYVPLWDGRQYFDCVIDAMHSPGGWGANCFGHPTMAFVGLHVLAQFLSPASYRLVVLVDLVLGALALWAVCDLWRWLRPERGLSHEAWAVTLVVGSFPVLVAGALQLNPDYGVLVFFLLALRALVRERPWQAALWGVGCSFSKEVGVALFVVAVALYLVTVARAQGAGLFGVRRLARWPQLLLPPVLLTVFLLVRDRLVPKGVWAGEGAQALLREQLFDFHLDPGARANYAAVGLLDFAWIPLLLALLGAVAWALRRVRRAPLPPAARAAPEVRLARARALFVVLLWIAVTVLLTRLRTYLNARYFLPTYPLLVLVAALGLQELVRRRVVRLVVLAALALVFAVSNERTLDPVSRRVWGTIPFGDHQLLRMTSITGECCGAGRDQLAYNLEFTHLGSLQDQLYRALPPSSSRRIGLAGRAEWFTVGPLDPVTFERRARQEGALLPRPITTLDVARTGPVAPQVLYLDLPGFPPADELPVWLRVYDIAGTLVAEEDGYRLPALDLVRKPPR